MTVMLYKEGGYQLWRCLHIILIYLIYSNCHLHCGRSHPEVHLSDGSLLRLTSVIRVPDKRQVQLSVHL